MVLIDIMISRYPEHEYLFPNQGYDQKIKRSNAVIPQDFRRTFKTLAGQMKITKEIRDRIQYHALHDVSSVHYDRYDYNEEKLEALLKWGNKLKEIMYDY